MAAWLLAAALSACSGAPPRETVGQVVDDAIITSRLKAALFRDADVSGFQVNVETYKGQVQIAGFVDTRQQKIKAERIARAIPGVRAVTNSIVVKAH
jgi:hyperosmotically inducible periplasmic protein